MLHVHPVPLVPLSLWWYTQHALGGDWAMLSYSLRMKARGVDLSHVSVSGMGLDVSSANHYANSGGPDLARMLQSFDIPPDSRIVDVGCGKGGACFTLRSFFAEVVGIDLCPEVVKVATVNAQRLGITETRFLTADALTFGYDRFSHAYLFNPFPASVVVPFMARLRDSLTRCPRRFTLLYLNPPEGVVDRALFPVLTELPHPVHRCQLYQH